MGWWGGGNQKTAKVNLAIQFDQELGICVFVFVFFGGRGICFQCGFIVRAQGCKSTWLWGSQTDPVQPLPAVKIQRQRNEG